MERRKRQGIVPALAIAAAVALLAGSAQAKAEKIKVEYKVQKGDTLIGISDRFGVTVLDIIEWNDDLKEDMEEKASSIDDKTMKKASFKLRPGMKLKVPGKPTGKTKVITYTVKKGDSLWSIGKKFHVKPAVIVKWNSKALDAGDDEDEASGGAGGTIDVDTAAKYLKPGMTLSVPGKPTGKEKTVKYKVKKGDSLWSIGKKYHVKPEVIVRWNEWKLGGKKQNKTSSKKSKKKKKGAKVDEDDYPTIHPGMRLVIHAVRPDLGERVAVHWVKKGETAKKIAKRWKADYDTLLAANFILPDDKLQPGMMLEVPLPVTKKNTQSIGSPQGGKLYAGEKMPPGPGYVLKNPDLAYGTSETITLLVGCIAHVQRHFEGTHDLVIGHISKQGGGKLGPHKSHRSGRDVDVGYYHTKLSPKQFVKVKGNLDAKRTNAFIECLVETEQVKYMFIDTYIQKALYHNFEKRGFGLDFLTMLFQYPEHKDKQLGIIRDEKGHDDHIHIRFVCPEDDGKCHD